MTKDRPFMPEPKVWLDDLRRQLAAEKRGAGPYILEDGAAPPRPGGIRIRVDLPAWSDAKDERGLIISHDIRVRGRGVQTGLAKLDATRLRTWALFFDRLDLPRNNMFVFGAPGDGQDVLEKEGILRQTNVQFDGGDGAALTAFTTLATLRKYETAQPGVWSAAIGPGTLDLPEVATADRGGLLLRLQNALPIPEGSVPIEAVLEFKRRRRGELLALRGYLEDLHLEVASSGDKPLAELRAFEKLDRGLAEQVRVSRESGLGFRMSTLESAFQLETAYMAALAAGAAMTAHATLPAVVAAAAMGAAPKMLGSLGFTFGLKGKPPSATPFGYITSYNHELPVLASW